MSGPAYTIRTARLVLRTYEPADAPVLSELVDSSLDHLRPWMPWAQQPATVESRVELIRKTRSAFDLGTGDLVYGIFNHSGTLLGGTGLHARVGPDALEIGYWIGAPHEGRGYVTEAAAVLTRVALEVHGMARVEIHCDPRNTRSSAVAERLGYTHDATLRRRAKDVEGRPRDTMVWSMFEDELAGSAASRVSYEALDALGRVIRTG